MWSQNLRQGLRLLRRSPGFALAVSSTLALGIGATVAIFSVVNAVLLEPLPYPGSERLVSLSEEHLSEGRSEPVSPANFFDWQEQTSSFEGVAGFWSPRVHWTGTGGPEQLLAATVTHDLFQVLGVEPAVGRVFRPEEDAPGAARVVVLAHGFWQSRFGGAPDVLGRTIVLDGNPFEIVGVMPAGFSFPRPGTELWIPLRLPRTGAGTGMEAQLRSMRILEVVARLADGATIDRARADLVTVAERLRSEYPESNRAYGAKLIPLQELEVGNVRVALWILLGAVVAVLLIACVNVSNLLLARMSDRKREIAVRTALGGDRGRLVAELSTESVVLVVPGVLLGLVVAELGLLGLPGILPEGFPRTEPIALDGTVLLFALAMGALAAIAIGVAPALRASRLDVHASLRTQGRASETVEEARARGFLVGAQVALALALLVAAGLLSRSLVELSRTDPGVRVENVLTVARIELSGAAYRETIRWAPFFDEVVSRVEALPGVDSAGVSLGLPLGPDAEFFVDATPFTVEGGPPRDPRPTTRLHVVSPGFFRAAGVTLVRGRLLQASDRLDAPGVAVINETMAERYWPGGDPIGRRFTHDLNLELPGPATREVVGVIRDVRHFGLERDVEPQIYVPLSQCPWPQMHLLVRTAGDPLAVARGVREAVWSLDPNLPVPGVRALEEVARTSVALPRFRTALMGIFAVSALALSAVGLYGVMAYRVSQRTSEIGLRMALGAGPGEILRLVLSQGIRLAGRGVAVGLVFAWLTGEALRGLLFGVEPLDAFVFLAGPAVLVLVAGLAALLPARRATRIDPLAALRGEG